MALSIPQYKIESSLVNSLISINEIEGRKKGRKKKGRKKKGFIK